MTDPTHDHIRTDLESVRESLHHTNVTNAATADKLRGLTAYLDYGSEPAVIKDADGAALGINGKQLAVDILSGRRAPDYADRIAERIAVTAGIADPFNNPETDRIAAGVRQGYALGFAAAL